MVLHHFISLHYKDIRLGTPGLQALKDRLSRYGLLGDVKKVFCFGILTHCFAVLEIIHQYYFMRIEVIFTADILSSVLLRSKIHVKVT